MKDAKQEGGDEGRGAAKRKQRTEEGDVKESDKKAKAEPAPKEGPAGLKIWDLGGNGDCAYRAVAGLIARTNGKSAL